MTARAVVFLALFAPLVLPAQIPESPAGRFDGGFHLRKDAGENPVAPKIADAPPPDSPQLRVLPIAPPPPLADAQLAVIRGPDAWRNWAALAQARYAAGDFDKAFAAVRQMRVVATARGEPLPLAADELFRKCKRAADALSLLE